MIIEPKVRGFICTTAHPEGCAQHVNDWISYTKKQPQGQNGPKKVLVIGASTGFGLASRISAAFGYGAQTIGAFFERAAAGKRTASAGWYNTVAFEKAAQEAGIYAKSINGDAFSDEIKKEVLDLIKNDWNGEVDLVIYSIASPRRTDPKTGITHTSVLKPLGQTYTNKTVDVMNGEVTDISIEPASADEVLNTEAVMGGDDWAMWMDALDKEGLLAKGAKTVAYTYIGPTLTHDIYRNGTIGKAKEHLEKTSHILNEKLKKSVGGSALISVNKALVTQASAAIPVVPLYISLLYKIMKAKGLHEGCMEQMWRLFSDRLYGAGEVPVDEKGRVRIDDWEMREDVQQEVSELWKTISTETLERISDIQGYRDEFYRLFGFGLTQVDYTKDVNPEVEIPSVQCA